jgi:ribonuclease P protein component
MIAKKNRLSKNLIKFVLDKGESLKSKLFIVKFKDKEPLNTDENKYCVVVSKKISNKATIRNKLRRQIYEAIRLFQKKVMPKTAKNIIFIPKKRILDEKYAVIEKDIQETLSIIWKN